MHSPPYHCNELPRKKTKKQLSQRVSLIAKSEALEIGWAKTLYQQSIFWFLSEFSMLFGR